MSILYYDQDLSYFITNHFVLTLAGHAASPVGHFILASNAREFCFLHDGGRNMATLEHNNCAAFVPLVVIYLINYQTTITPPTHGISLNMLSESIMFYLNIRRRLTSIHMPYKRCYFCLRHKYYNSILKSKY